MKDDHLGAVMNSDELVQRWKTGDRQAADQLWMLVQPDILKMARAKAYKHAINEEGSLGLTNQVAAVAWRKRGTFTGTTFEEFRNWILAIFNRVIMKSNRFNKRRDRATSHVPDDVSDGRPTASRLFRDRESTTMLLSKLNPEDAQLLKWFHMEGRSVEEISELLLETGTTLELPAIRQRMSRARKRLLEMGER